MTLSGPSSLTADISDAFLIRVAKSCDTVVKCERTQLVGPMESESNIEASAHNKGGATGLIQFDNWDRPHKLLELPSGKHLTWQALAAEDDLTQFDEVEDYFKAHAGMLTKPGQLYADMFIPAAALHANFGPTFVICGERPGDPYQGFYKSNPLFDTSKKGFITGQDMANAVARALDRPRAREVMARMSALVPLPGAA